MKFSDLVGKTIVSATVYGLEGYSDEPAVTLRFVDGTAATIWSSYGGYDGKAEDEYPCFVGIADGEIGRADVRVIEDSTTPNAGTD